MNQRYIKTGIVISVMLLFGALTSADRASAAVGTIETKTGERFEKVTYAVDYDFKVIRMQLAGGEKNLSFLDIKLIQSSHGDDITPNILDAGSTAAEDMWQVGSSDNGGGYRKQLWDFAFRLAGNFTIPGGDYYQGLSSGIGFEGDATLLVSREFALRLTLSRTGVRLNRGSSFNGPSFHATKFLGAVERIIPFDRAGPGKGLSYIYGGLGSISNTASYGGMSASESKLLTEVGGGGVSFISEGLGIDYSASFGLVWVGSQKYESSSMHNGVLFDFKLGLSYWIAHR